MTTTTSRLDAINLVMIPASDQDRSIEFYCDALGFEKRTDIRARGSRPRVSSVSACHDRNRDCQGHRSGWSPERNT